MKDIILKWREIYGTHRQRFKFGNIACLLCVPFDSHVRVGALCGFARFQRS